MGMPAALSVPPLWEWVSRIAGPIFSNSDATAFAFMVISMGPLSGIIVQCLTVRCYQFLGIKGARGFDDSTTGEKASLLLNH